MEQVLEETGDYIVTALNAPVPVQVQETLKTTGGGMYVRTPLSPDYHVTSVCVCVCV